MTGGHSLGGACSHIKAFWICPIPTSKGNSVLKACRANMPYCMYAGVNTAFCTCVPSELQTTTTILPLEISISKKMRKKYDFFRKSKYLYQRR